MPVRRFGRPRCGLLEIVSIIYPWYALLKALVIDAFAYTASFGLRLNAQEPGGLLFIDGGGHRAPFQTVDVIEPFGLV